MILFLGTPAYQEKPEPLKRPPPPVTIANPVTREVIVYRNFPATLTGRAEIEIRARVSWILEEAPFKEGDEVKEGAELFKIEPETYDLAVKVAAAAVDGAEANQELARQKVKRLTDAREAVSAINLEIAEAERAEADAALSQAELKLEDSKIDQEYSVIKAPINGRMSNLAVDPGNLVGNGEATLLATIIDDQEIRVNFEVPEWAMIRYLEQRNMTGGIDRVNDKKIRLTLADGSIYEQTGIIDFINNKVDTSTRTAKVRAVFPNKEGKFSSGLYGLVGFPSGPDPKDPIKKSALLVPAISIMRDLGGDLVWIVDDSNTVRRRGVEIGDTVLKPNDDPKAIPERETVVNLGLDGTERVIVAGLQRARDGAVVNPQTEN
ncbi:efflux RND transporter periplasmic adaptor subunit [bacterium]|nr:efflux RND transporter periplasmic adaptor subunit [bacterium]